MKERNKTLEFIIENQNAFQYSSGELRIINSIRLAAKVVNYKVNKAGLVDIVDLQESKTFKEKNNKKMDVYAMRVLFKP
jgi:fructose-1,6-bisphosphatase I